MTHRFLALAATVVAFAAACDGCEEPVAPIPQGALPVGSGGVEIAEEARTLTYVGQDPRVIFRGASASLRFTWKTVSGLPVAGEVITISAIGDAATVAGTSFTTDVGGGVEVPVTAGLVDGDITVVARASDLDGSVREAAVKVQVRINPAAGLVVRVQASTRIPLASANARVLVGSNPPACAALLTGTAEPTSQLQATFAAFPSQQTFSNLPTGQRVVVIADGVTAAGVVVARGCSDAGVLPGGGQVEAVVDLVQLPTVVEGDYDVLMHMALGDALPAPYDTTVDLVTALLADPAGYATYVALREIDRQTGFTTFVTRDGVEQTYRQVEQQSLEDPNAFFTWQLGRTQLDATLEGQLGQTYVDVTNVGAGIRDVVTDFEVGARFNLDQVNAGELVVNEAWRELVLYWPLPCADGDLACARRVLALDDAALAPVLATYGASVVHAPVDGRIERFAVATDPHGLELRYGALLLAILEQVVFPSLPDGVAGDSFGDVLSNLVGCENIAASISSDPVASIFIEGMCEAGLSVAAAEVENRLLDLQVDSVNPAVGQNGLAAGGSFALADDDADLTTELVDEYSFSVSWNQPADAAATQDISAPIVGAGLRTRDACVDDSQCGSGFSCQARGTYLKVARVELGCARAPGALVGGAACSNDAQCGSGMCAPVGAAGAMQCFKACDALNDCALGQVCNDVGGFVDLDDVMNGLGDMPVRGCAAP